MMLMKPGKKQRKVDKEIDLSRTQSFLSSAIADISGYIKFSDTKVSIIMAALGVIIAGIINCREIVYDAYKSMSQCECKLLLFLGIASIFCVATIMVYYWGLHTLISHTCKLAFSSVWYIKESKEEYPFELYKNTIERMSVGEIIDTMAAELYKLNDINKQKIESTQKTIRAFSVFLVSLLAEMIFIISEII